MGEPVAIAVLVEIIGDAVDFFSVGKNMNDKQLGETARLLLQEFYFLKITDLKLFFDRLKTGFYGQLYDRLDGNVIMLHLRAYCDERLNNAEELSLQTHQQNAVGEEEEKFIIATGAYFVARSQSPAGNPTGGYFEVEQRELATQYTYAQAVRIKQWLIKNHFAETPEAVKIKRPFAQVGLMPWMQEHAPHLVAPQVTYKQKAAVTAARFREIEGDGGLSEYEKYCAKVSLIGLVPMGEGEFESYNEEILRGGVKGIK